MNVLITALGSYGDIYLTETCELVESSLIAS